MKIRVILLTALVGLGVASCGEDAPPASSSTASLAPAGAKPQAPAASAGASAAAAAPGPMRSASNGQGKLAGVTTPAATAAQQDFIPPADAQWTILCYAVNGPSHVEEANNLKAMLIRKMGRPDWYVIHARDASNVYFGFYRDIKDPTARRDIDAVKALELPLESAAGKQMGKPFSSSAFVQLSAPDPTERPEWNLWNVGLDKDPKDPTRAFWSIQIMAFRDNPLRKEAAVQAVETLRKQGVEAYYYHGESISSVCVGAFPVSAVKAQKWDGGDARAVARQDQALLVTNEPIPDGYVPKKLNGQDTVAVAPRLEVVDEKMAALIQRFPTHAVNYTIARHKGADGTEILDPSFLVEVPRAKGNGLYDSDDAVPLPPTVADRGTARKVAETPAPQRPGAGTLRGIGEKN